MIASSVPSVDALKKIFETHLLTLERQHPQRLVLTQRLKWWALSLLVLWSTLFIGTPIALIILLVVDCRRQNSCQGNQFIGMLLVLLPFLVLGMLATYGVLRRRVVILDGANNLYKQKTRTILGVRKKTYALSDLEYLDIQKKRRRSRGYTYSVYQLVFHLRGYKTYRLAAMITRQPLGCALVQMQAFLEEQRATF